MATTTKPEKPIIEEAEDKKIEPKDLAPLIIKELKGDEFCALHNPGPQSVTPNPYTILKKKVINPITHEEVDQFAIWLRKAVDTSNPDIRMVMTSNGVIEEGSKQYKDALVSLDAQRKQKLVKKVDTQTLLEVMAEMAKVLKASKGKGSNKEAESLLEELTLKEAELAKAKEGNDSDLAKKKAELDAKEAELTKAKEALDKEKVDLDSELDKEDGVLTKRESELDAREKELDKREDDLTKPQDKP